LLDQLLPASGATPANITVNDHSSGNTGEAPAILGVQIPDAIGACGGGATVTQAVNVINGQLAAGGIVEVSFASPSPTQLNSSGACNWGGNATEFPAVITPGNAAYNTYMYGEGCTSSSPCGGVWSLAQALSQITSGHHVVLRILHEGNLCQSSWWWGTCGLGTGGTGTASNANYVTLFKQVINYLRSLGVSNIDVEYNFNNYSGAYSQNDPGAYNASTNPGGRNLIGGDLYGPTTVAGVESDLSNSSVGFTYAQTQGVPVLLGEAGVYSSTNSSVATFTYNNNIWVNAIQAGSGITNLVGAVIWCQNWCLDCQLSAAGLMSNTITRGQLPVITN
jgi:hypothetical protein